MTIYLIVALNLSITLLNIYIAIRIWLLGRLLARIGAIVVRYENFLNLALQATPAILDRGQNNIYRARQRYELLRLQVTKIKQLIVLVNWSYQAWKRSKII